MLLCIVLSLTMTWLIAKVVAVLLVRDLRPRTRAGRVPTDLVAPAFALGAPVLPVAVLGRELGRFWRVRVGAPVHHPEGRGPLAVADQILTLHFTLPLKTPVKAQELVIEVYDPSYFVDFSFEKDNPVGLVGAPAAQKAA